LVYLLSNLMHPRLRSSYSFVLQYSTNVFALIITKAIVSFVCFRQYFLCISLVFPLVWWFYRLDSHEFSLTLWNKDIKSGTAILCGWFALSPYLEYHIFFYKMWAYKGKKKKRTKEETKIISRPVKELLFTKSIKKSFFSKFRLNLLN